MIVLPDDEFHVLVVRTDFSSDEQWRELKVSMIPTPAYDCDTFLLFIDDDVFDNMPIEQVRQVALEKTTKYIVIFIVDAVAINHPEHPIVVLNIYDKPSQLFRAVPPLICDLASNFHIANLDYEDFEDVIDADGILRDLEM